LAAEEAVCMAAFPRARGQECAGFITVHLSGGPDITV